MTGRRMLDIPRRELVTLLTYLETGSHKAAAHHLGISESTSRQRVSLLLGRVGARNAAQAVWALRAELEAEMGPRVNGFAVRARGAAQSECEPRTVAGRQSGGTAEGLGGRVLSSRIAGGQ